MTPKLFIGLALGAALLVGCVPTAPGSSTLAPIAVLADTPSPVVAERPTFLKTTVSARLAGLDDTEVSKILPAFTFDEVSNGASKSAPLNPADFTLRVSDLEQAWNLKLENVQVVRRISSVEQSSTGNTTNKRWRENDTLEVIFSLTPPKGSVGKAQDFSTRIAYKNAALSLAYLAFAVKVQ